MQEFLNFTNQHQLIVSAILVLLVLLVIIEFLRAKQRAVQITSQQATQLINRENAVVVDIRSHELYKEGHIIDAVSLEADELKSSSKKIDKYRTRPLIIMDQTGAESQKIAAILQKQGYNAYSLAGGLRGWTDAQLPLIKE